MKYYRIEWVAILTVGIIVLLSVVLPAVVGAANMLRVKGL